ncbi:hypothetical protein D3C80_1300640 [compost metagenome]
MISSTKRRSDSADMTITGATTHLAGSASDGSSRPDLNSDSRLRPLSGVRSLLVGEVGMHRSRKITSNVTLRTSAKASEVQEASRTSASRCTAWIRLLTPALRMP